MHDLVAKAVSRCWDFSNRIALCISIFLLIGGAEHLDSYHQKATDVVGTGSGSIAEQLDKNIVIKKLVSDGVLALGFCRKAKSAPHSDNLLA